MSFEQDSKRAECPHLEPQYTLKDVIQTVRRHSQSPQKDLVLAPLKFVPANTFTYLKATPCRSAWPFADSQAASETTIDSNYTRNSSLDLLADVTTSTDHSPVRTDIFALLKQLRNEVEHSSDQLEDDSIAQWLANVSNALAELSRVEGTLCDQSSSEQVLSEISNKLSAFAQHESLSKLLTFSRTLGRVQSQYESVQTYLANQCSNPQLPLEPPNFNLVDQSSFAIESNDSKIYITENSTSSTCAAPVSKKSPRRRYNKKPKSRELFCQHCSIAETPEWRRGPYSSGSICNACGLFFKKLKAKFGVEAATKIMFERKSSSNSTDRTVPNSYC